MPRLARAHGNLKAAQTLPQTDARTPRDLGPSGLDPGPRGVQCPCEAVDPVRHGPYTQGLHEPRMCFMESGAVSAAFERCKPPAKAAAVVAQDVVVLATPFLTEFAEDASDLHLVLGLKHLSVMSWHAYAILRLH